MPRIPQRSQRSQIEFRSPVAPTSVSAAAQAGAGQQALGQAITGFTQTVGKFVAQAQQAEDRLAQSNAINAANAAARDAQKEAITSAEAAPDGSTYESDFEVSYGTAKDDYLKDLSGGQRDRASAAWDAQSNKSQNSLLKASLVKRAEFIDRRYEEETNAMSNAVADDPTIFGEKLDQLNNNLYNDQAREDFGAQFDARKKEDEEKIVGGYMNGFLERQDWAGARKALKDPRVSKTMDPKERATMSDRIRNQENGALRLEWTTNNQQEREDKAEKDETEDNIADDSYVRLSEAKTEDERQAIIDGLKDEVRAGRVGRNVLNSAVTFEKKAQIIQEADFVEDIMESIFDDDLETARKKAQEHFDNNHLTPETRRKLGLQIKAKAAAGRDALLSRKITAAKTKINDDFRLYGLAKALDIRGDRAKESKKLKNEANLRMLEILSDPKKSNISVREATKQAIRETLSIAGAPDVSSLPMNKLPKTESEVKQAELDMNLNFLRVLNPTEAQVLQFKENLNKLQELKIIIRNQQSEKK